LPDFEWESDDGRMTIEEIRWPERLLPVATSEYC